MFYFLIFFILLLFCQWYLGSGDVAIMGKRYHPSPSLVVLEGDSCLRSREFECLHRILDEFLTGICCKIVLMFEKTENKFENQIRTILSGFLFYKIGP